MNSITGLGSLALAIAMMWLGQPSKGESAAPFLRVWIVGQIYVMATMILAVIGIALLINGFSA